MQIKKRIVNSLSHITFGIICAMAVNGWAQTPVVLFQDGFETGTPGLSPAANEPSVGSYLITGTTSNNATNEVEVLSGPYPGGPSGAYSGNNYLMIDRVDFQTANQILHCLLAAPLYATNTPFHVELRLWADHLTADDNWPQMVLGSGTSVSGSSQLLYSADVVRTGAWEWYNGSYHDSGLRFSAANWDLVEIDWDGTNLTGTINGTSAPLGSWGTADKPIDRMLIRTGTAPTQFFVDDVKITTTAPILVTSVSPGINATGVGRQPNVQIQLSDGTQSVNTNSIQFYFNNVQVAASIQQSIVNGINVTTVAYVPPILPYSSANSVRCVYSDTMGNQYSKSWTFSVYAGDTIFSDSYESSLPQYIPFHYSAADGTNCLAIARIGAGRPYIDGAARTDAAIGASDTLTLTLNFGSWKNLGQNGTLAVIPEYVTNQNGTVSFTQTGQINLRDDGAVSVVDLTGAINQYLTATMNTDAWNSIVIQYANGSGYWSVSVNGSPFESFYGKSSQGGSAYGYVNGFRLATAGTGWTWCDSITLSNTTANTLLFADNFDSAPAGAPPATNSPSVGTYATVFPDTVPGGLLVTDGVYKTNTAPLPPNAPQVGMYDAASTSALVETGTGHGGTQFVALTNGMMEANFITPIPAGVSLHAQAWFKYQTGQVGWGFTTGGTNEFAKVTLDSNSSVYIFDGTNQVDTAITHGTNSWEECQLDYVVGSQSIALNYNGHSLTVPIAPSGTISGLFFVEDDAQTSSALVDDVSARAHLGDLPTTNPTLQVTPGANQMTINWSNGAGYILQVNTDLSNPNGWVSVPGGGVSPVQVTSGAAAFYRLIKPF